MDPGPCDAMIKNYYYNTYTGGCHRFNYGGCEGNKNRFDSFEECRDACIEDYEFARPYPKDEDDEDQDEEKREN